MRWRRRKQRETEATRVTVRMRMMMRMLGLRFPNDDEEDDAVWCGMGGMYSDGVVSVLVPALPPRRSVNGGGETEDIGYSFRERERESFGVWVM